MGARGSKADGGQRAAAAAVAAAAAAHSKATAAAAWEHSCGEDDATGGGGCGASTTSGASSGSSTSSGSTEVDGNWLEDAPPHRAAAAAALAYCYTGALLPLRPPVPPGGGAPAPIGGPVPPGVLRLMDGAYGHDVSEVGYETEGHRCIDAGDVEVAADANCSLLYGEVLPTGVVKMLDGSHLGAAAGRALFDLGAGTGKLALQAFLSHANLDEVVGVELAPSRYAVGEAAVHRLLAANRKRFRLHAAVAGREIAICEDAAAVGGGAAPLHGAGPCASTGSRRCRVLHLRCGNIFDMTAAELRRADMVVLEIDLPDAMQARLCHLLALARGGTRLLSYLNLRDIWPRPGTAAYVPCPLRQAAVNVPLTDRFATSWAYATGHHFFLWRVVADATRYLAGGPLPPGVPPHFADYVADALGGGAGCPPLWLPEPPHVAPAAAAVAAARPGVAGSAPSRPHAQVRGVLAGVAPASAAAPARRRSERDAMRRALAAAGAGVGAGAGDSSGGGCGGGGSDTLGTASPSPALGAAAAAAAPERHAPRPPPPPPPPPPPHTRNQLPVRRPPPPVHRAGAHGT